MNYTEAIDYLNKGRNKNSRPWANNTRLERRGESVALRLYSTDVVTFRPDGSAVLDTGGWRTVTTKDRINSATTGWNVYSVRGEWRAACQANGADVPFAEGMTVWPDGRYDGAGSESDLAQEKKTRRDVAAYAKRFAAMIMSGNVAMPGGGDCWFCGMQTQTGQTLGESTKDRTHLLEHIRENYYVPSLAWRAFERDSIAMRQSLQAKLMGKPEHDFRLSYFESRAAKNIRKYILRQLGMAA